MLADVYNFLRDDVPLRKLWNQHCFLRREGAFVQHILSLKVGMVDGFRCRINLRRSGLGKNLEFTRQYRSRCKTAGIQVRLRYTHQIACLIYIDLDMGSAAVILDAAIGMEDCRRHRITPELTEIIEAIIISTGFVSNFVQVDYTTGMAHAMYNGFTILPSTEENHHLHGEVVSYGILVMLTADKQYEERDRLLRFNKSIGLPTCLADIHARPEDLPAVTEKALAGIDVRVWPYPVTQQMLIDAVMELEQARP